jgi:dipeptidyl aminopeptidase/acylaminoacyl peptidase
MEARMSARFKGVVAFVLLLGSSTAFSTPFSSAPTLLRQDDCYAWYAGEVQQRLRDRPGFAKLMDEVECFRFTYLNDGVTIEGHMARPRHSSGEPLPVLIYNRGGNDRSGLIRFPALIAYQLAFATHGYVTISTQYRAADEFGGRDVDDILALLPIVDGMPGVDATSLGMWGSSRGGMMSYLASMRSPRFRALAVVAGVSNAVQEIGRRPEMEQLARRMIPDYAAGADAALRSRSVVHQMDRFPRDLPVLLVHGDADTRVHVSNATELAAKLAERKQPHRLVVYPGGDHDLANFREQYRSEVLHWFDSHLKSKKARPALRAILSACRLGELPNAKARLVHQAGFAFNT